MPTGLIVSKLVTTVILLLSNVITMFLPNFVQLDEARFYKDMDSLTIFENTLDEPIPQTEICISSAPPKDILSKKVKLFIS